MNFDIKTLAAQKASETGHSNVEWMQSLESARLSLKFIDIDYKSLEILALASPSPAHFTVLSRLIYQYGKSHPNGDQISDVILGMVNNSPFSLKDWIEAIDRFNTWLIENQRKIDFLPMLKYLECCIAAPDARESGQTLTGLITDMLNVSGYDG